MVPSPKWQSYTSGRLQRHAVPILVWLGALVGVVVLMGRRSGQIELAGMARSEQRQVAALSDGRVALVPVCPFQQVQKGQTLAVLEDDQVRAALATAAAEATRLRAELKATEARLAAEADSQELAYTADARRFAVDIEQTRLEMLQLTVTIETDRITLQRLQIELDRLRGLHQVGAASPLEYDIAVTEHAAAAKAIEENERALAQLKQDLRKAIERRDAFAQDQPTRAALEEILLPLRAAVSVQESQIAELSLQRATLVLYSPLDGVVSEVLRGAGEVVRPGEPILTVLASRPSDVITYVNAADANRIDAGAPSELALLRAGTRAERFTSEVIAVGPAIVQLPLRLRRNPAVPEWGCPVRLSIPVGVRLRCDELVAIHLSYQSESYSDVRDTLDRLGGAQ
jgi:multidrug resistance efflux pump